MIHIITISINYKQYKLKAELIHKDSKCERYKISGKTQLLIIENNRPFFRNRGLKHRRFTWKLVSSNTDINNSSTFEKITTELTKIIDI